MKIKEIASYIIQFLVGMFCGGILGYFMVDKMLEVQDDSLLGVILNPLIVLIMFCIAFFIQIIIHEAGHLVFGLMSGYTFVSFRILNFMWKKTNGKIKLYRYSLAGTGGQCLLGPPDYNNGNYPYKLYGFGGVLLNLISVPIFLLIAFTIAIIKDSVIGADMVTMFFMILVMFGMATAMLNGIPMRNQLVSNDGYNTFNMGKNPASVKAHWQQLKINEKITEGADVNDLPDEWFSVDSDEDLKDSMVAAIAVFNAQRILGRYEFAKANEEMQRLLKIDTGTVGLHRNLLINDIIFCELMIGEDVTQIEQRVDKNQRKFMKAMCKYPTIIRTRYAFALLAERNEEKAKNIMSEFDKMAEKYPYEVEIQSERKLMKYAEDLYGLGKI